LYGDCEDFKIIPNTSNFEKLINSSIEPKFPLPLNFVLIVKSIEERARFDLLIELAALLKDQNFIVAGKGPLLDYYKNIIAKSGVDNIQMLGFVPDETLVYLYKKCNLVVNIASYGEGFGLPIIEGYLFNKPVIASNVCAIPEVIISPSYLFENNIESLIKTYNYATCFNDFNFQDYYEVNFSNKVINEYFKTYYNQL
jgi:glycosyltransferase involved in cell wall biosynthesis